MTGDSPSASMRSRWIRPLLFGLLMVALNVAAFYLIPDDLVAQLGEYGYLGIFLVSLIGNATVVVPVPYPGLVARLATRLAIPGVVGAGALGSVLGESVAFFVGRSGRGAVADTRFYRWVQQQMQQPWRAFLALVVLSAPPNPVFDVAGLTAGAMGVPFPIFFFAVLLGRGIRFLVIALAGISFSF